MPTDNWDRIQDLFLAAAELPAAERGAFLDANCAGQAGLREDVESLLAADASTLKPLGSAVSGAADSLLAESLVGRRLGAYRVIGEIGRGGMGSVYLATRDDDQYKKEVAIKLIRHGMDTEDVLNRFRHERQILANLDHPYISRLLDGGTAPDGRPFFVMEYVQGEPLDTWCQAHNLNTRHRCELFLKVCEAVAHAHRKLVVHRDLKPANILITGDETPKLLDFGVAKLLDPGESAQEVTSLAMRPMTPRYASPEQVRAELMTTATDIYSLGAIFYELLCGVQAHRLSTMSPRDMERVICEVDPPMPSEAAPHLRGQLQGDLDAIVSMAMRKEAERRYASVDDLASDVRRYLSAQPVLARHGSFSYRAAKYLRRNTVPLAVGFMLVVGLAGGSVVATWQALRAHEERRHALASQSRAEASQRNAERQAAEAHRQRAFAETQRAFAETQRAFAETQQREADLQSLAAETQRQLANRRFEQVRQLAGKFLLDFHDAIAKLPGSTPARKMVVETGLRYYDTLVRDAAGNKELLEEIARGYDRLGDVQGNPYFGNLGDIPGAQASYGKAAAIRAKLSDTSQGFLSDRIRNGVRIAQVLMAKADYKGSERTSLDAIALGDRSPDQSFDVRDALATAWGTVGDVKIRMGLDADAIAPYRQQLALRSQLAAENKDEAAGQRGISLSQTKLGDAYSRMGQMEEAYPHLKLALAVDRRLSEMEPQNSGYTRKLFVTYLLLGDALVKPLARHLAKPEEITGYYEAASSLADRMAAADPDNRQPLLDIARISDSLGDWLQVQKNPDAAIGAYRKTIGAMERLNRISPEAPGNRGTLIEVYQRLAISLTEAGRFAEAMDSLRTAEQHLALAEKVNPGLAANTSRRAEIVQTKAQLYAAQKLWDDAIASYRDALAILESQHRLIPDNQQFLNDQPALLESLAEACEAAGRHDEAVRAMRTALDRYREIESKRALLATEEEDRKGRMVVLAKWETR